MQANHRPKLVIYFCLSVDKSLYKPLCIFPQSLGVLVWDVPAFIPRCGGVCATLLLRRDVLGAQGRVWQQLGELGPKAAFLSLTFHSPSQPWHGWGRAHSSLPWCSWHSIPVDALQIPVEQPRSSCQTRLRAEGSCRETALTAKGVFLP